MADADNRSKYLNRKDEVGMISKSIDKFYQNMKAVVKNVLEQSISLADSSRKFEETFSDIAESVANVDIAVEEIAQGSTVQTQETSAAKEQVLDIGKTIEVNAQNINLLNHSINKMTEFAENAAEVLEALITSNKNTSQNIDMVSEQTEKTNQSAEKIQEAVGMIMDIAQQTNLLSLNASIEAARAGEAGKGFAVVAEQIRKLSEDSSSGANTIEEIVKQLIQNSQDSVTKMKQVIEDSKIQHGKLEDTKESFYGLKDEINSVSNASKEIFDQTRKLEELKNNVNIAVEQLASISEENAASTEETSASVQTLNASVDESKNEINALAEMSQNLQNIMDKFVV